MMSLHNHSVWSDGSYSISEIVDYASKNRLKYLGISDHYLTRKVHSLDNDTIKGYISEIERLKNSTDVNLYGGVEIDFTPRTDLEDIDFELLNQLDYVLFENVQNENERGFSLWQLIQYVDRLNIISGFAHTDFDRNFARSDLKSILPLFESKNMFIELNTNPYYTRYGKYYFELSTDWFENIKNYNIPISIGCDMHEDLSDLLNFRSATDFIDSNRLQKNIKILIDTLDRIRNHA